MTDGRGYPIAAEALDLDLYRLLCVFAASGRILRVSRKYKRLESLRSTFEPTEVSQSLVSVAVMLRSVLDSGTAFAIGRHDKDVVGRLRPDLGKPRHVVPLAFREACNKIIHADTIDFWHCRRATGPGALRAQVRFGGVKGGAEWRADIDIFSFVESASWLS